MDSNILSLFPSIYPSLPEVVFMFTRACMIVLYFNLFLGARAADLATAPSEDLLKVYAQLRSLQGKHAGGGYRKCGMAAATPPHSPSRKAT